MARFGIAKIMCAKSARLYLFLYFSITLFKRREWSKPITVGVPKIDYIYLPTHTFHFWANAADTVCFYRCSWHIVDETARA